MSQPGGAQHLFCHGKNLHMSGNRGRSWKWIVSASPRSHDCEGREKNRRFPKVGVPPNQSKSSILVGCSIIDHPLIGVPPFRESLKWPPWHQVAAWMQMESSLGRQCPPGGMGKATSMGVNCNAQKCWVLSFENQGKIWGFPSMGVSKNGCFIMDNPFTNGWFVGTPISGTPV